MRELEGFRLSTLIAINFENEDQNIDVRKNHPSNLPKTDTLFFNSESCEEYDIFLRMDALRIGAEGAVMITFKPPNQLDLFTKLSTISQTFVSS